jgi:hypothetical protein
MQSSDVWSNLASTLSNWFVQRVCLPDTRQFACFVSCGSPMLCGELYIQFVVHFMLALYQGGSHLCYLVHKPAYTTMADDTHASTSTKHGVNLVQKFIGEHHDAPVRDYSEHQTVPRDESCMLNLQPTI